MCKKRMSLVYKNNKCTDKLISGFGDIEKTAERDKHGYLLRNRVRDQLNNVLHKPATLMQNKNRFLQLRIGTRYW